MADQDYDFPGLGAVEQWAHSDEGEVDPDAIADLRGAVAAAVLSGDRTRLLALGDRLSPLAAALDRRLSAAGVERWAVQAAGTSTLAAVVRGALDAHDRAYPASQLARIPLGLPTLRAMADANVTHNSYVLIYANELAEAVGASHPQLRQALMALDVAGFIHLSGAEFTRSWRALLLPLAREALSALEVPGE